MARARILRKDGTPTPFFFRPDDEGDAGPRKTVYKDTPSGVKRMRGVRFDTRVKRFRKD